MGSVVCCCISLLLHIAFPLCPIRGIMDWACSILHSHRTILHSPSPSSNIPIFPIPIQHIQYSHGLGIFQRQWGCIRGERGGEWMVFLPTTPEDIPPHIQTQLPSPVYYIPPAMDGDYSLWIWYRSVLARPKAAAAIVSWRSQFCELRGFKLIV